MYRKYSDSPTAATTKPRLPANSPTPAAMRSRRAHALNRRRLWWRHQERELPHAVDEHAESVHREALVEGIYLEPIASMVTQPIAL